MYGRHDEYTWGFRIYRTSYSEPNADAEFNKAIEILHSYMRKEIFYHFEHHGQLWGQGDPMSKTVWTTHRSSSFGRACRMVLYRIAN